MIGMTRAGNMVAATRYGGAAMTNGSAGPPARRPAPLSEAVSKQMKRMRRASTKPELLTWVIHRDRQDALFVGV